MAYPVTSVAEVKWYGPDLDPYPTSYGYSVDRFFQDFRLLSEARDPGTRPTVAEQFWRGANTQGFTVLPDIRGAIISIDEKLPDTPTLGMTPVDANLDAIAWYDATTNPTGVWKQKMHELLRYEVALYSESTPVNYGNRVRLKSSYTITEGGGLYLFYKPFAPYVATTDSTSPPYYGINLLIGLKQDGTYNYKIKMPLQATDTQVGSDTWIIEDRLGNKLDFVSAPTGQEASESKPEWLYLHNCAGMMVMEHSRLERGKTWVYAPKEDPDSTEDFYDFDLSGEFAIEVWGSRGWYSFGKLTYQAECVVESPAMELPSWVTTASEFYLNSIQLDDADITFGAAIANGIITATITNNNTERSPLLLSLQEVHRTVLGAAGAGDPQDLTSEVVSIDVSKQESGKGATANIKIRNWKVETPGAAPTLGFWTDKLKGIGKLVIKVKHDADVSFTTVFTGYATALNFERNGDNLLPELTIECQDRTFFFQEGRATGLNLPSLGGWTFKNAMTLILTHWEVPTASIVYAAGISDTLNVPNQLMTNSLQFDAETDLFEIIDKVCDMCNISWRIGGDGLIYFDEYPGIATSSVFTLDETTANAEDRIYSVSASKDYRESRSIFYGSGIDKFGFSREYQYYNPASFNDTSPSYVGRNLWSITREEDNPRINNTILRKLYEMGKLVRIVQWDTLGRYLYHGQRVTFDIEYCDLPAATELYILSSDISIDASSDLPIWKENYTCALVSSVGT